MKLLNAFILYISLAVCAPAKTYDAINTFKAEVLNPVLEEMCLDMSKALCSSSDGHKIQYAVYDPMGEDGPCACADLPSKYITNTHCSQLTCTAARPDMHFDVSAGECFCSAKDRCIEPSRFSQVKRLRASDLKQLKETMVGNSLRIRGRVDHLKNVLTSWDTANLDEAELLYLSKTVNATVYEIRLLTSKIQAASAVIAREIRVLKDKLAKMKRQEPTSTVSSLLTVNTAEPTGSFVPPPKTDITPELLNQSLNSQSQNTAIVNSVIPDFVNGHLTFLVQMEGIVAALIPINSSTYLPCDGIGTQENTNIMVVPKYVQDGTPQTTVADCMIIAINMYAPDVLTYWIQTSEGAIETAVGSPIIHDIDQMRTDIPLALTLRASANQAKRSLPLKTALSEATLLKQIIQIDCLETCPAGSRTMIRATRDFCGCLEDDEASSIVVRALSKPDVGEATMTPEACAAMTCVNNNNRPASYNPFTRTCWCQAPAYVEDKKSGWSGRVRALLNKLRM